ncbi:MAG TPA: 5-bromo-4-chloroindolyl phosphate hydrolysis family protein [Candidatus Cybelea sp.]|nr:5-bromo-4-chloroindolyl phosphate hydrolysis family protein [Candidatus Cybelea sp.]
MDPRGDGRYVIAGLVAAAALPAAVFVAAIPFYAAVPIAGVLFAATAFLLAPRRPLEGLDVAAIGRGQIEAAQGALEEADTDIDTIVASAKQIRTKDIAAALDHLAVTARRLLHQVEQDPAKLSDVRRLVAVYLPRTREIATSFADIENRGSLDAARVDRLRGVLKQIDETFQHFGDRMVEDEAKGLDVELNLLEDSIKQELGSKLDKAADKKVPDKTAGQKA